MLSLTKEQITTLWGSKRRRNTRDRSRKILIIVQYQEPRKMEQTQKDIQPRNILSPTVLSTVDSSPSEILKSSRILQQLWKSLMENCWEKKPKKCRLPMSPIAITLKTIEILPTSTWRKDLTMHINKTGSNLTKTKNNFMISSFEEDLSMAKRKCNLPISVLPKMPN